MTRLLLGLLVAVAVLGVGLAAVVRDGGRRTPSASVSVVDALGGPAAGYARAVAPRAFVFPADHGPHPDFRTEWWYYTGNLATEAGRHFGFQLTLFRVAMTPRGEARGSAWAATQVYMGHFALTDTEGGRFHHHARLARDGLGLAGARGEPFRVWAEDWAVEGSPGSALPMRLRAGQGDVAIDLVLDAGTPVVVHGERGLSRKGPGEGNASYYYSLTRMPARGTVHVTGAPFAVRGTAWMDREWSTSALAGEQVGWDWFALQLADGRDVMFYRLRRRDGSPDPFSAGTLVAAGGTARPLTGDDVRVEVLGTWASPVDGTRYPARWRLAIPGQGLVLEIAPRLADQEFREPVRYWEGAVRVSGREGGQPVDGVGYVELVGYADGARTPRRAGEP